MIKESKWGCFENRATKIGTIIACVLVLGVVADARHIHRHVRVLTDLNRCNLDSNFYFNHERWCDSAARVHLISRSRYADAIKAAKARADVFGDDNSQTITIQPDFQATGEDSKDWVKKFLVTQTAADVAMSRPTGYSLYGWYATAQDLTRKHPPLMAQATPAERHFATVTTRTTTTTTTTTTKKPVEPSYGSADPGCNKPVPRHWYNADGYGKQHGPCT